MSLYDPPSPLCLRSRTLLRDTLLKDLSLRNHSTTSLPPMSPPSTPSRNPAPRSDYSPSRPRHQHHLSASPPMGPTSRSGRHASDSYATPAPLPRRPHTAHPSVTHSRDHSRSPLSTPDHHTQPYPHLITPHEHVLRTRLERVLFSADISKRRLGDRETERGRSPSAGATLIATSLNSSTRTIKRNRSKTESNVHPSPSHFSTLPVPPRTPHTSNSTQKKRSSTGRSIRSGSASLSGSGSGKRSGTTPPLVLDDDEGSGEGGEPRMLLTPPSTPSPPGLGFFQVPEWGYKPQCYPNTGEDDDDDDDESCSSSCSSYREGSSISSSVLHSSAAQHLHSPIKPPLSPQSPHLPHSPTRRPFNARRASAQCRAMEGYVSFANVEGLGVPPDDAGVSPSSPHAHSQGKGVLTALGWGGGVVRKILGGGEKAEEGTTAF